MTGQWCSFYNRIIGNLMVCQERFETNLLQPFAHPENSEWVSIISVLTVEANIASKQKQA